MVSSPNPQHDRACDQCSVRKIKCGRSRPCRRCSSLSLECSYSRLRKKKGPSGKRIGVIRQSQPNLPEQAVNFSITPNVTETTNEESSLALMQPSPSIMHKALASTEISAPTSAMSFPLGLLNTLCSDFMASERSSLVGCRDDLTQLVSMPVNVNIRTIDSLIHTYIWRMSKYYPLVDGESLLLRLQARENTHNFEFSALLLSICAYVLLQPVFKRDEVLRDKPALPDHAQLAEILMDNAIAMRNVDPSYMEKPSVDSILTSFFLCVCFFNRQLPHAAWSRLCEAVTLAEIMEEQSLEHETVTVDEKEHRATLYRILAVTEHAYAVQYRYAISRNLLSRLPGSKFNAHPSDHLGAISGVATLVSLFSVISVDMLDCWNDKCAASSPDSYCPKFTTERALDMHRFISDVYRYETADDNLLSEAQIADVTISQQWLHNRLWNVCHSHGLLSEDSNADSCWEMSLTYALDIARDTMGISERLTMESLEVNGISIIGKLYDIASSVVMLLSCYRSLGKTTIDECNQAPSAMEILNHYVSLLATFGGGQHPYLAPLMTAMVELLP
ncbi:hypothetical protein V1520DRAFT_346339 [Lipomyces starkeyi]|uniref:Zn(2)-C6 fungal-type domain-containing protein n=1 Tax=Lipomyces starkeyi NRRL Y-11557 TaxID=675824 RepID=A0A1E3Q9X8_LIPST|nr:hypothetical protein LIPSTDRAFT_71026 [Lipomyces starkeyi NRRL Y-11557]